MSPKANFVLRRATFRADQGMSVSKSKVCTTEKDSQCRSMSECLQRQSLYYGERFPQQSTECGMSVSTRFGIVLCKTNKDNNVHNSIINGLIQLQNRGYDSAGMCVIQKNKFIVNKYASVNNENAIDKLMNVKNVSDNTFIGIGHNRWATHGIKNHVNAHPHLSCDEKFALVHNGIIENYNELKQKLIKNSYTFKSQTDTEIIVNLLQYNYDTMVKNNNVFSMTDAIKKTIEELTGTYGLLIQSLHEPNNLYCVRNGSPLLIGQNEEEIIVTSEQSGFCNKINNYITLQNNDT